VAAVMKYANGKSTQGQSEKGKIMVLVGFIIRNLFLVHDEVKISKRKFRYLPPLFFFSWKIIQ
jgi:hypothetical protein